MSKLLPKQALSLLLACALAEIACNTVVENAADSGGTVSVADSGSTSSASNADSGAQTIPDAGADETSNRTWSCSCTADCSGFSMTTQMDICASGQDAANANPLAGASCAHALQASCPTGTCNCQCVTLGAPRSC